jgi:hypothetical protein
VSDDFEARVRSHLESHLESGEELRGVAAATYQKTFSGSLYAVGVTDRRLLLQPLENGGERFKLMLMRGGSVPFGGESQQQGVLALAEWLRAAKS